MAGSAAELHGRDPGPAFGAGAWVLEAAGPALVLGSTQDEGDVDRAAAERLGVAVVRRRSGGGAVLVGPGQGVWVDVLVPAGHPRWDDDVARAAHWVGEAWARALSEVGLPGGEVHRGGLVRSSLAEVVCFAGLGPGEVAVGGAKAVGLSQRRTRAGARFQTMAPARWDGEVLAELLAPGLARRDLPPGSVADLAVRPVAAPGPEVVDALARALADLGPAPGAGPGAMGKDGGGAHRGSERKGIP